MPKTKIFGLSMLDYMSRILGGRIKTYVAWLDESLKADPSLPAEAIILAGGDAGFCMLVSGNGRRGELIKTKINDI